MNACLRFSRRTASKLAFVLICSCIPLLRVSVIRFFRSLSICRLLVPPFSLGFLPHGKHKHNTGANLFTFPKGMLIEHAPASSISLRSVEWLRCFMFYLPVCVSGMHQPIHRAFRTLLAVTSSLVDGLECRRRRCRDVQREQHGHPFKPHMMFQYRQLTEWCVCQY